MKTIVKYSIDKEEDNAKLNIKNKKGELPLNIAIEMENEDIINILIENEANINLENINENTPLIAACRKK